MSFAFENEYGIIFCGDCHKEIMCNACGDMPEKCPNCGAELCHEHYGCDICGARKDWDKGIIWITSGFGVCEDCYAEMPEEEKRKIRIEAGDEMPDEEEK